MMEIEDEWTRMENDNKEDAGRKFSSLWGPPEVPFNPGYVSRSQSSVLHNFTSRSFRGSGPG